MLKKNGKAPQSYIYFAAILERPLNFVICAYFKLTVTLLLDCFSQPLDLHFVVFYYHLGVGAIFGCDCLFLYPEYSFLKWFS